MEQTKILIDLGFSLNEAKIYLAGLETGTAPAQYIADVAGIKRTTGYSVLNELIKKGIFNQTQKQGKSRFIAVSPDDLLNTVSNYQKNLKTILPELNAIFNAKQIKPKVLFYEGDPGIKKIYFDTIDEKPDIILEWNSSEIYKAFAEFPKNYLEMRRDKNIRARRIAPADKFWSERKNNDAADLSMTKLLPTAEFNIPVEINIYNNKVAFMSYGDKMGLIIESRIIASAMRQIYDIFWNKIGE